MWKKFLNVSNVAKHSNDRVRYQLIYLYIATPDRIRAHIVGNVFIKRVI